MAGAEASWPPVRASDADRDQVLRRLREGVADGRLSQDTFMGRVESALRARHRDELRGLVADLVRRRRRGPMSDLVTGVSRSLLRLEQAWRAPRLPPLRLPMDRRRPHTIGRDPGCDLLLGNSSVSRRHALLSPTSSGWELSDLASTNGTLVNGWRVSTAHPVAPGDEVTFGGARFRVAAPTDR